MSDKHFRISYRVGESTVDYLREDLNLAVKAFWESQPDAEITLIEELDGNGELIAEHNYVGMCEACEKFLVPGQYGLTLDDCYLCNECAKDMPLADEQTLEGFDEL